MTHRTDLLRSKRTLMLLLSAGVLLAAGLLAGCGSPGSGEAQHLAEGTVYLKDRPYTVEVARTLEEHQRGLQYRTSMPASHGMLFIYSEPRVVTFWMKDTPSSLDILYFDKNKRFINGYYRVPPCLPDRTCDLYPSQNPVGYVLELNASEGESLKLKQGDAFSWDGKTHAPGSH